MAFSVIVPTQLLKAFPQKQYGMALAVPFCANVCFVVSFFTTSRSEFPTSRQVENANEQRASVKSSAQRAMALESWGLVKGSLGVYKLRSQTLVQIGVSKWCDVVPVCPTLFQHDFLLLFGKLEGVVLFNDL